MILSLAQLGTIFINLQVGDCGVLNSSEINSSETTKLGQDNPLELEL